MTSYVMYLVIGGIQLALLAQATDLLGGHAGRMGVAAVLSAGVAGYTYAIASTQWAFSPWIALLLTVGVSLLQGLALGFLLKRLNPDGFLLVSFGLQVAFVELTNNATLTGGALGIRNVPSLNLPFAFRDPVARELLTLVPILCLVSLILTRALGRRSALGRLYHWVRDDQLSADVSGVDTGRLLVSASIAHCLIAAVAGVSVVSIQGYVAPRSFDLWLSLKVLTVVIISGVAGPPALMITGAAILIVVSEAVSGIIVWPELVGPFQLILANVILVTLLVCRRRGLLGPVLEMGPSAARD